MAGTIPTLSAETPADLRHAVVEAQSIQKRNPPSSLAWRLASVLINTLAAELARRGVSDNVEAELICEYAQWAKANNATELGDAAEALTSPHTDNRQKTWLRDFIRRWEAAGL